MGPKDIFALISAATDTSPALNEPVTENDLLAQIKNHMQIYERLKYPNTPYQYKKTRKMVNHTEVDLIHSI